MGKIVIIFNMLTTFFVLVGQQAPVEETLVPRQLYAVFVFEFHFVVVVVVVVVVIQL